MGSSPNVVEDLHGVVQIFSDGSIKRNDKNIDFTPFPVKDDGLVVWKDFCYDKLHSLNLRLYKPKSTTLKTKFSIIYYLHGGGFCLGSFTWPNIHNCCLRISSALQVIVVAPDYRLAPEHRLPAAVDDSLGALKWIQEMARNPNGDVVDCFDFDRFFVMGDSSGGNLAHHLAVRLGPGSPDLTPIKIRGYVMLAPFFGGLERTESEMKGLSETFLDLETIDR